MNQHEAQARLEGQMAAVGRKPINTNPYPLGTTHSRAWARGYREIEDER